MSSASTSGGENPENVDAGGVLPMLNWSETAFQTLLSDTGRVRCPIFGRV
ncbi:hypothetical protein Hanom_Chr00s000001g01596921 [Helianthus anomalus]